MFSQPDFVMSNFRQSKVKQVNFKGKNILRAH